MSARRLVDPGALLFDDIADNKTAGDGGTLLSLLNPQRCDNTLRNEAD